MKSTHRRVHGVAPARTGTNHRLYRHDVHDTLRNAHERREHDVSPNKTFPEQQAYTSNNNTEDNVYDVYDAIVICNQLTHYVLRPTQSSTLSGTGNTVADLGSGINALGFGVHATEFSFEGPLSLGP